MDIFHIWGREHSILLSCEVDGEGEWGNPPSCGVCDSHPDNEINNYMGRDLINQLLDVDVRLFIWVLARL